MHAVHPFITRDDPHPVNSSVSLFQQTTAPCSDHHWLCVLSLKGGNTHAGKEGKEKITVGAGAEKVIFD